MKLPYRYRGLALVALLVLLLPWGAWRFALRDTVRTWRDCRELERQLAESPPLSDAHESLQTAQEAELILSGLLLEHVRRATTGRSVEVAGYEPLVTTRQDALAIHTAQLTLTGGYAALLRVVDELERTLPQCRVQSLAWHTLDERRTRRTQLYLTIYLQQITRK